MSNLNKVTFQAVVFVVFCLSTSITQAGSKGARELTTRLNIVGSSGKPTNDMLGLGLVAHFGLSNNWYAGFTIDHTPSFDFERTATIVGIQQDSSLDVIDAVGSATMVTAFIESRMPNSSGDSLWFWNLGAGFHDIDMGDVSGPVEGGGTFDITTNTNTELVLTAGIGWQTTLSNNWGARFSLTATHHAADWKVRDRVSGNTGTIDTYTVHGIRSGLTYRF